MNIKKILIAATATSILASSSVFAEDFYVRGGVSGAMSMRPSFLEVFKNTSDEVAANIYLGAGMNFLDSFVIGAEVVGWMPSTAITKSVNTTTIDLKNAFTVCPLVSYSVKVSDMLSMGGSVKAGYARGIIGANTAKDSLNEDQKKSALEMYKLSSITAGGSLFFGFEMSDNMMLEVLYNLDYYTLENIEDFLKTRHEDDKKSLNSVMDSKYMLTHKLGLGVKFSF